MLVHSQVGILVCTPVVSRTFWVTVREIQQELLKGKGSSLADVKPWKMTGLGDWNQEAVTSLSAPLPCLASFSALPLSCAQFPDSHIATKWGVGGRFLLLLRLENSPRESPCWVTGKESPPHPWASKCDLEQRYRPGPTRNSQPPPGSLH